MVAVDVGDYLLRDNSTLGYLLSSLTIDIPSVLLASVIGYAAGSFVAGTSVVGIAVMGSLAIGPFMVALVVGGIAGYTLYQIDDYFGLTEKLGRLYDEGLSKLADVWKTLGTQADARFDQLAHSHLVSDLRQETGVLAERIGREADLVRTEMIHAW